MLKRYILVLVCLALLPVLGPTRRALAAQYAPVTRAQDWVQTTADDFASGERAGIDVTRVDDGELRLSAGATTGTYVSPVVAADFRFNAIVAHWSADVPAGAALEVELRTREDSGWSDWQPFVNVEWLVPKGEFYPEAPLMLSGGLEFQYRLSMAAGSAGSPVLRRITITYLDSSIGPTTTQAKFRMQVERETEHGVPQPAVISRAGWGANEDYRTWEPEIRPTFKMVVHHTVTPNDYAEDQAAAWVRAIYYYHAVTREWGDIGYNYVVDQYGNVYEGRYGGPGVVGGHVYGYNYGSVGIALMGTHGNSGNGVTPTAAALDAVRRLCLWEASRSYIHPLQSAPFFGATPPNLAGHRDYPPRTTTCPGDLAYAALPELRQAVWEGLVAALPRYQVAWTAWDAPSEEWKRGVVHAGQAYTLTIGVRNTGWYVWPHAGTPSVQDASVQNARVVRLGYHWLDGSGQVVAQPPGDDLRTPLAHDVAYGQNYAFPSAQVVAPPMRGTYTLAWDMVHEGVAWFHDANANSPRLTMTLTVEGAIRNGGFEQEGDWTIYYTSYPARYTRQVRRSGERALQTGIENPARNTFSYSSAEQAFRVPSVGDVTLRYWQQAQVVSGDFGYVYLRPEGGGWRLLQSVRQDVPEWTEIIRDLSAYAGQGVTLRFGTYNDGRGGVSAMYIDDVSVGAGVGPTPTPTPTPSPCSERAVNGDFETDEGWVLFDTPYDARYTTAAARAGRRSMQLGMADPAENAFSYSSAEQRLSIPSGARATLSLWYSAPQGGGQGDYGYFLIRPDGGAWRILRIVQEATDGWVALQEDLSHLAGGAFTLRLGMRNDGGSEHAVMYVDSASVEACNP